MRTFQAVSLAALGAIAGQPVVFLAWLSLPALIAGEASLFRDIARHSWMAALFSVPFVLIIGVPAALFLAYCRKLSWWLPALVGFAAAGLPAALYMPGGGAGHSDGGNWYGKYVQFVVNGEPTHYAWLNHLQSILFVGVHGLVGATAFYLVWRRIVGPDT